MIPDEPIMASYDPSAPRVSGDDPAVETVQVAGRYVHPA